MTSDSLKSIFETCGGSITGLDHIFAGNNNHDAYFKYMSHHACIALVCDGCGGAGTGESKARSEVGSQIGVRLIGNAIVEHLNRFLSNQVNPFDSEKKSYPIFLRVKQDVLANINVLARAMGGSFSQTIKEYFLFTVVGAVITRHETSIFSIGDGYYFLNGEKNELGPFPDNEPPYFTYNLVDSSVGENNPELLNFQVHQVVNTEDVQSLLIATDGLGDFILAEEKNIPGKDSLVGPVSQFWDQDKYFNNPDTVRRTLKLASATATKIDRTDTKNVRMVKYPGHLKDDTTLCVIRRKKLNEPDIEQ